MENLHAFLALFRAARAQRLAEIDVAVHRVMMDDGDLEPLKKERRELLDLPGAVLKAAKGSDVPRETLAAGWPATLQPLPPSFLNPQPEEKLGEECVSDVGKAIAAATAVPLPEAVDLGAIIAKRQERAVEEAARDAKFREEGRPVRRSRPRLRARDRDLSRAPMETDREGN